jgi:hypothetical protein
MIALRVLAFVAGALLALATFGSSVKTVVVPRGVPSRIGRFVFVSLRRLFRLLIGKNATYERRDRIMSFYGPLGMMGLLASWLVLIIAGFTLMFWGLQGHSFFDAFRVAGSSVFTLGFERPPDLPSLVMVLWAAALGLLELALLITYLPSVYGAFSRREALVSALEVRAGNPPVGAQMILRFWVLGRLDALAEEVWTRWEEWFADIEETHVSFPALAFFRSPEPNRSWVTSAGAVLDAASLVASTVEGERDVRAEICIRAGYLALRRIADFFRIPHPSDPRPDDPIAIKRADFDKVCGQLEQAGVPLKPDRDQAWRDFAGWRVNYDAVLLGLTVLTDAPQAPWSTDRAMGEFRDLIAQRRLGRTGRTSRRRRRDSEGSTV